MLRLRFSKKAVADLSDIWNYTADTWSEEQADKYYNSLISACKYLTSSPKSGRQYDKIAQNIRGYHSGKHIIFYTNSTTELLIVRILHECMDLPSRIVEGYIHTEKSNLLNEGFEDYLRELA